MSIEFAGGWLQDLRPDWWMDRFGNKPVSQLNDEPRYQNSDGSAQFANLAEEVLTVNKPFLDFFSDQGLVSNAITSYAGSMSGAAGDGKVGAHCRAALHDGSVLTVDQGVHQPEDNDTPNTGFCLHVTTRLTSTTEEADKEWETKACHLYVMQNADGSLYVTEMS